LDLKKINYIFLFIILGFFGKTLALSSTDFTKPAANREKVKFEKSTKCTDVAAVKSTPKLRKQKRPKKPKGIQVIVPVVSSHTFNSFCNYSEFFLHEVDGSYSLLLHYSHGKRGPPSNRA
jgi:hypothetical protein